MGSKRSVTGNIGVAVFAVAFVCTVIAFISPNWLVSDTRITGAKFERLGLWAHCFASLPDPTDEYQRRFHVGCRWVFDPFTFGYDQIKGFLMPPFIVITQFFYTLAFILVVFSFLCVLLFFLCCGPEQKHFIKIISATAVSMLTAGVCGVIAVGVFAIWANKDDWMLGHENNYFGWSFVVAIVGSIASFIVGALFFVEATIQRKRRNNLKDSRMRLETSRDI